MSRQYHLRSFLRDAPNVFLKRYLAEKGIGAELDWDELEETEISPMLDVTCPPDATTRSVNSEACRGLVTRARGQGRIASGAGGLPTLAGGGLALLQIPLEYGSRRGLRVCESRGYPAPSGAPGGLGRGT